MNWLLLDKGSVINHVRYQLLKEQYYLTQLLLQLYYLHTLDQEFSCFIINALSIESITSISYNYDQIFFSSTNGLFIFDKYNKDISYANYILNNVENKNIYIVHYDSFRDKIWIAGVARAFVVDEKYRKYSLQLIVRFIKQNK